MKRISIIVAGLVGLGVTAYVGNIIGDTIKRENSDWSGLDQASKLKVKTALTKDANHAAAFEAGVEECQKITRSNISISIRYGNLPQKISGAYRLLVDNKTVCTDTQMAQFAEAAGIIRFVTVPSRFKIDKADEPKLMAASKRQQQEMEACDKNRSAVRRLGDYLSTYDGPSECEAKAIGRYFQFQRSVLKPVA